MKINGEQRGILFSTYLFLIYGVAYLLMMNVGVVLVS
jgi:hypothetical protein